ncbi:gamma-secretase subunit Aph-1b isoform X2 [Phycodurus eques]|uniref:gamma-secretase subunit Aph-1b isoform X2 n=1 Tax=Phycodurus eques TaxID=693459 RepID=UPI002ACD6645|nr:gamma-secretase subunit Aph-1b isoform X2 [Phycodurus eques]
MTVAVFFGCTFIAFGPAIALFLFTIAREPLRVIFLIAGAFFWLVSLLLSSLVWFISVQVSNKDSAVQQKGLLIFGVVLSVLLQETFRFAYYKLLKKANEGLLTLSQEETMPISIRQLAYVSGLGFGFMSGAFSVVNILADSVGPGTIGIHGDSQHYFLSSDLPEPGVCCQPGSHLYYLVPNGCLGLLLRWRVPQEPQTLPDLQRQRFPACQPPIQITQHSRELAGLSIQKSLSHALNTMSGCSSSIFSEF